MSASSPKRRKGLSGTEALTHCGECHTPRNLAFALNNRKKFAGAIAAGWHAFNISSDRGSGIGARSDKEIADYSDIKAVVDYLRSIPPVASSEPGTIAPPAPPSPKQGGETADALGKQVFEGACVSCHSWTGISTLSPYATIADARAVNDRHATNVAQIVISGTRRHTPCRRSARFTPTRKSPPS
jgi:mono/diheme cytochrome c family protein